MISVIIPAYNAEKFIERAILSAVEQTMADVEVIVVDDGSEDLTLNIAQALAQKHKNIKVLHTENGGVSCARNIGLDTASGEYISFLDADDMLLPDGLERMIKCLQETGGDICATRAVRGEKSPVPAQSVTKPELWDALHGIKCVLADHPSVYSCWAKLYRADKLNNIRFPEGKHVHEDSYFVFLCILSGMQLVKYDIYTYIYCENSQSATRGAFSDKVLDMLVLAKEKASLIREKYPELEKETINVTIKAYMALLHNLCRTKDKRFRSYETEAIQYIQKNKKYYIPCTKSDNQWFFIITNHLFGLYKIIYQIKFKI